MILHRIKGILLVEVGQSYFPHLPICKYERENFKNCRLKKTPHFSSKCTLIKILLEIKLLPEEQPYNVGTKRSVRVAPFLEMYYNQQLRK